MSLKKDSGKKYNKVLFPIACIILCILIILLIFLINKDKILTNLKETDFFGRVFGSTPAVIEQHEVKADGNNELPMKEDIIVQIESDSSDNSLNNELPLKSQKQKSDDGALEDGSYIDINGVLREAISSQSLNKDENVFDAGESDRIENNAELNSDLNDNDVLAENKKSAENNSEADNITKSEDSIADNLVENDNGANNSSNIENAASTITNPVNTTTLDLCFVVIDGDGAVSRKIVKRTVKKNDSPLTTALTLLLVGPDPNNKAEANCRSLIPDGARLLSARVSNGVAYLNFNDEFEFNTYGVEGSIHQLEQIVYTATSFSTVNSVQFLIEGQKREYLGSEGQWIGTPLSRSNF